MKHLEEEELVEHYDLKDPGYMGESERHLKACPVCTKRYAELCRILDTVATSTPPARRADYIDQVWQSMDASLPVYEKPKRRWMRYYRPLAYRAACVPAGCRNLCCRAPVGAQAGRIGSREG